MINQSCLEIEINSVIYRREGCAWCNATGRHDDLACSSCDGQGSVLAAQPPCPCPHCKGAGREPSPEYAAPLICLVCRGSGWVLTIDRFDADQAAARR